MLHTPFRIIDLSKIAVTRINTGDTSQRNHMSAGDVPCVAPNTAASSCCTATRIAVGTHQWTALQSAEAQRTAVSILVDKLSDNF
jgi:hypothetical protein